MKSAGMILLLVAGGIVLYEVVRKKTPTATTNPSLPAGYGNAIYVPPPVTLPAQSQPASKQNISSVSVPGFSPLLSPEILRDIQDIYQNHGLDPTAFETEATFLHALGIHATGPLQAALFSAAKTLSDRAKQLRST